MTRIDASQAIPQTTSDEAPLAAIVAGGAAVGVVGGVGAWLFRIMIAVVHNALFLGEFSLSYDASVHTPLSPWGAGIILVPVVGSIGVIYLVEHYAPEAKGHGVPEVMDAIHHESGVIRPIVVAVKALASALTIGSGGSVGREGPIVQIGAAAGSSLGQAFRLTTSDLALLISAGAAAGIAATFNAPLGGLLFSIELLLVTTSPRALATVVAGIVTSVAVARLLIGSAFAFSVDGLAQVAPIAIGWADAAGLIVLGVALGIASAGFILGLYRFEDRADGTIGNPYLRHMLGMLALGIGIYGMSLWLGSYSIQGLGYASITDVLDQSQTSVWVLLALFAAKWLATTLTLGTGGSGGIFSPSMMLGATLGGAVGHGLAAAGLPVEPLIFVLAGMAGMVAATTGATVTAVVMLTELSGDFGAAVPLLIVAAVAVATRHMLSRQTIYTEKLRRRNHQVPMWLERTIETSG